jgi:hypothetical protein
MAMRREVVVVVVVVKVVTRASRSTATAVQYQHHQPVHTASLAGLAPGARVAARAAPFAGLPASGSLLALHERLARAERMRATFT